MHFSHFTKKYFSVGRPVNCLLQIWCKTHSFKFCNSILN